MVQSGIVTISGPTYVTDKKLKTYTSNTTGDWYERWNPDTNLSWGNVALEDEDTYTRIWPAGWYDVALRNDSTTSVLRRRRLNIEVCWQCSPEYSVTSAGLSASLQASSITDDWGLYGAGPWLSTGTGEPGAIVRYYDLTGLHEPQSPFASIAWLGEDGGTTEDPEGRWAVSWSVDDAVAESVKIATFRIDPTYGAASYRFAFAVDPDVGDPTDDRSGYDSARGLVYVEGGSDGRVVGLLLREKGANALRTVRQFGVRNRAPRAPAEARQVQESAGIYMTSEAEDVQFVLSTGEMTGTHTWQVVLLRAASVSRLQALADAVTRSW